MNREVKIAKFTAKASAECFGAVENLATVTGVFTAACLPPPGTATVGPLEARATVVCKARPCVDNVQCEVPQAVCVDETYTVTGKARNCSPDPEDITITIKNGAGAVVKTQKFVGVAAGASVSLTSDPISCQAPGTNRYTIEAKAENECGATDIVTSNCSVECKDLAKLSVLCQVDARADLPVALPPLRLLPGLPRRAPEAGGAALPRRWPSPA